MAKLTLRGQPKLCLGEGFVGPKRDIVLPKGQTFITGNKDGSVEFSSENLLTSDKKGECQHLGFIQYSLNDDGDGPYVWLVIQAGEHINIYIHHIDPNGVSYKWEVPSDFSCPMRHGDLILMAATDTPSSLTPFTGSFTVDLSNMTRGESRGSDVTEGSTYGNIVDVPTDVRRFHAINAPSTAVTPLETDMDDEETERDSHRANETIGRDELDVPKSPETQEDRISQDSVPANESSKDVGLPVSKKPTVAVGNNKRKLPGRRNLEVVEAAEAGHGGARKRRKTTRPEESEVAEAGEKSDEVEEAEQVEAEDVENNKAQPRTTRGQARRSLDGTGESATRPDRKMIIAMTGSTEPDKKVLQFMQKHMEIRSTLDNLDRDVNVVCTENGQLKTTAKLLKAVALGKIIVSNDWIMESFKADQPRDPFQFLARDLQAEKHWKIPPDWSCSHNSAKVLEGFSIMVTPALQRLYGQSGFKNMEKVSKAAGAKSMTVISASDWESGALPEKKGHILLGLDPKKDKDAMDLARRSIPIYTKDLLSAAILRRKLNLNSKEYQIQPPKELSKKPTKERTPLKMTLQNRNVIRKTKTYGKGQK